MYKKEKNYAFIDSQNVNLGIRRLGWRLDFKEFMIYLRDKYYVDIAYIFLGYLPENQDFYKILKKQGYNLIFKEITKDHDGNIKGNVDAELVLQVMIDYHIYDKAIIVSSDGDFTCLVKYLRKNNKLKRVITPNIDKCSVLLKRSASGLLVPLNDLRERLQYEKGPYKH